MRAVQRAVAPDILDAIAAGRQPPELTAHRLDRTVDSVDRVGRHRSSCSASLTDDAAYPSAGTATFS